MTRDEQWKKTKKSIMRYLREGWSINYAQRSAGLNPGSDQYVLMQNDKSYKAMVKPYLQSRSLSVYDKLIGPNRPSKPVESP